jgi:peptidoglycan/xylan/chitin deacetylase (PgdA/CDA1 family)
MAKSKSIKNPGFVRIFFFHRVVSDTQRSTQDWVHLNRHPTQSQFEIVIKKIIESHKPISMGECAARLLANEPFEEKYYAMTFDDGYADNFYHAVPILRQHAIPATFYIATNPALTGALPWYDLIYEAFVHSQKDSLSLSWLAKPLPYNTEQRLQLARQVVQYFKQLPCTERRDKMTLLLENLAYTPQPVNDSNRVMNPRELKEISQDPLFTIGAHTHSHQILSTLSAAEALSEIQTNVEEIEKMTGTVPRHFAYPNGKPADFTEEHKQLLRQCGFLSAVTTVRGVITDKSDVYALERFPFTDLFFSIRRLLGRPISKGLSYFRRHWFMS